MWTMVHTEFATHLLLQVDRWAQWQLVLQHNKAKHACRRSGSIQEWLRHRRRYSQGQNVSSTTRLTWVLASTSTSTVSVLTGLPAGRPDKDCSSVGCGPEQGCCTAAELP